MSASPIIDQRHLDFVLFDLLQVQMLTQHPRYAEHNREIFEAAVELAHKIALEKFFDHNRKSDLNEPKMVDGKVVLIAEIETALRAFNEAGFMAILADTERGGMQLPFVVASACDGIFAAANSGTTAYPMLARAAANLLEVYGSETQKTKYMQPILDGRFYGTMCLSEPQAGSSLADITTTAYPQADGCFKLRGAKMWISAGDHEIGENIVHLILARIAGAPAGVRGISLFVCPRFRVDENGQVITRNDVRLAGLNHKMGQRGSVNTFLKFGEADDCYAELVGKEHHGLNYMFQMMNEERIGVGMGAVQQGVQGYLCALNYARERKQGRHVEQKNPESAPVAIIEHADVRRMLLLQKAFVEAGHFMCLFAAQLVDLIQIGDEKQQQESSLLLDLLTPIVKAWCSDTALKSNELAIQVLGGYGYTREFAAEQCYRDNRINPIHEGTNGIQALDLLGRKVMQHQGAGLKLLLARMRDEITQAKSDARLHKYADQLSEAISLIEKTTTAAVTSMMHGQIKPTLANAEHFMKALGHTCAAWLWLWQARVSTEKLADESVSIADSQRDFYLGKIQTCQFFFQTELPQIEHACALVINQDDSALMMQDSWY